MGTHTTRNQVRHGGEPSAASRADIARRYAETYSTASKKEKGRVLDALVKATGWSRDNARRRMVSAVKLGSSSGWQTTKPPRKSRSPKYSEASREVLEQVWRASAEQCGKYLAAAMATLLDSLERHGELVDGHGGYDAAVRRELLAMSPATIDRYLRSAREGERVRVISTPKPSALLRSAAKTNDRDDDAEPGYFGVDIVPQGLSTFGTSPSHIVSVVCSYTGWTFTRSVRNNAHVHILGVLKAAVDTVPFAITELELAGGNEVLYRAVSRWATRNAIRCIRPRGSENIAEIGDERKADRLVDRSELLYSDTSTEIDTLNGLWRFLNDRSNFLTPTKKVIGQTNGHAGRRKKIYDAPATPLDRLLDAKVISPAQETELLVYRDTLNPAELTRRIESIQARLSTPARTEINGRSNTHGRRETPLYVRRASSAVG